MFRSQLLLLLSIAPQVLAQSIVDFSQLPACAASCYSITTAQSLCVPPKAPSSSQTTYDTCFCHSNYLTQFPSDVSAICNPPCTNANDRTAIQTWFNNFCKNIGADAGAATTAAGATAAATGASSTDATGTSDVPTSDPNQTWWDLHARWIAMAIVLIVGFSIITVAGVLWKRRYERKKNSSGTAPSGGLWGPNPNQHFNDSLEQFHHDQEKVSNVTAQPLRTKGHKMKKLIGR